MLGLADGVAEALRASAARAGTAGEGIAGLRAAYDAERVFWNEPRVELSSVVEVAAPLGAGVARLRLYRPAPAGDQPALVFLHGGGFVVGSLDTHDRIQRLLARRSGVVVVGVDYPLSPEHRFPVALDQVEDVILWIAEHARELAIDPGRLAVGGDSAGAHLALAAALGLRRRRPGLLRFLLLYYGLYGSTDFPSRRRFGAPAYGLTGENLAFYERCYLGPSGDPTDARYDLLKADLRGLPPSFLGAAALDPLLDDSLALASALEAAGSETRLRVYDGVLHGFLHWSRMVPTADAALTDGAAALAAAFHPLSA
jgi:acetyl esterase